MKRVIAILSLVVLPVMIFAQTSGKLSGVVTSTDGTPLAGANVVLEGTTMGAATDEDGQYFILDVAVGTYAVRADYIGYKTHTVNNIRVSVGLTTGLDFSLDVAAVEGEEVVVTAERPLINLNATNTTAILDAETVQALPLRDIADAVGLQAGVVTEDGDTHVRGGRDGDNAYYLDGVLLRDTWTGENLTNGISQRTVGEISVQQGGLTAEYGNANGGVMLVTTETGGSKWTGSAEFVTDLGATEAGTDQDKLYSYGNQLLNFNIGGPIGDNIRFYLNVENEKNADADPSWGSIPFADVTEYQGALSGADSAAIWVDGDPDAGLNDNYIYFEEFVRNNQSKPANLLWAYEKGLADPDFEIPAEWFDTTYVTAKDYEQRYGPAKNAADNRLRLGGNVVFDFKPFRFKVGGQMYNYEQDLYQDLDQLLNWENPGRNESEFRMGYVNATWGINTKSFLKVTGSYTDYTTQQFNRYHKDDFDAYGMRTTDLGSSNYYYRGHGLDALAIPALVSFNGYGEQYNNYLDRNENKLGLRLDYVNQLGVHELRGGLEYYNTKISFYQSTQMSEIYQNLARVDVNYNGTVESSEVGGVDVDDWQFAVYRNAYVDNLGYNIYGDEATKYNEDDHGLAPGNPVNMRFYVTDKLEYKDIVMNIGLSYESFDPNAMAPDSDGDGYGDSDGFNNIDHTLDGRIDRSGTADESFKWEPIEAHTSWLPRIGFAFPVSDKTVFRAQYGNYMQNVPLQFLYLTDSQLSANLTQGNATVSENPTLKPERTTSYEVGFSQQIGDAAAIDIAGFYKEVRDYILQVNRYNATRDGSDFVWNQYVNGDYGVTTGFQMNIRMRRTKGFLADINYTMMWARGTGSDPASNFDISWTGDDINDYPTIINRLDYDQRHTGSIMLDYRTPQRDGLLSNLGANAVMTFGSGQAYTPYSTQSFVFGRTWNVPIAAINSADMPWTTRVDMRIDKGFNVGGKYINLYVLVLNALNSELVNNVYGTTGQAGEDGWLESPEGQVWLAGAAENYPNVDSASLYGARLGTNARWGIPRTVRFGIQVNI